MSSQFSIPVEHTAGKHVRAALLGCASLLVAGLPATAHAAPAVHPVPQATGQEAAPATDQPAEEAQTGNEIVVTATKREQTLQNVPVAVTVTTAEVLNQAKIRDIKDLASVVPSLRVVEHQSAAQTDFDIRGFGNGANNAGIEPSVGVFVDGVYRSRSAAQIADFPDVKRVEVLRGPQSTLFGKNASAGVISIVTEEPQFRPGGSVELSYGNYNAVVAKARVTAPLSDTVAFSLASGYNRRDGTARDLGTGDVTNQRNRSFVRGQLLFTPDNQLKVRLIGDYGVINEVCCAVVNIRPSAATGAIRALGGQVNTPAQQFDNVVYNNFASTNHIKNYGVSGQVDYAMGPVTLTSITAWRRSDNKTNQDSDFTSLDILGRNTGDVKISTFTQELRAATNLDGPLNFLAGAYYFRENINQAGQITYGSQTRLYANALTGGTVGATDKLTQLEGLLGTLSSNPGLYLGKFFAAGQGLSESYALRNQAISVFGQADFKIAPRLTLTGGINYTHDKKTFSTADQSTDVFSAVPLASFAAPLKSVFMLQGMNAAQATAATNQILALKAFQFLPPFLNVPNAIEPGRTSDGNVSYTARLAFDAGRHVNLYASFATGFKASSVNLSRDSRPTATDLAAINGAGLGLANLSAGTRFAGPEKSTVYEAGMKANWGVATLNVAVFKESIKGFQSNLFTGTGFVLGNAGKESVFGFEFEGAVHPVPELTIAQALTYLKPKYDDYKQSPVGDASGQVPAGIPPISLTSAVTWDHVLASGDHFVVRGDWHYESSTQVEDALPGFTTTDANGNPDFTQAIAQARNYKRTVSEFSASVTYRHHSGIELTAWGRNLSNNRYYTVVFDSPLQPQSVSAYLNQPRTYGISASYKF
jgi:outer membrane receptor protein involved in Fe transport